MHDQQSTVWMRIQTRPSLSRRYRIPRPSTCPVTGTAESRTWTRACASSPVFQARPPPLWPNPGSQEVCPRSPPQSLARRLRRTSDSDRRGRGGTCLDGRMGGTTIWTAGAVSCSALYTPAQARRFWLSTHPHLPRYRAGVLMSRYLQQGCHDCLCRVRWGPVLRGMLAGRPRPGRGAGAQGKKVRLHAEETPRRRAVTF